MATYTKPTPPFDVYSVCWDCSEGSDSSRVFCAKDRVIARSGSWWTVMTGPDKVLKINGLNRGLYSNSLGCCSMTRLGAYKNAIGHLAFKIYWEHSPKFFADLPALAVDVERLRECICKIQEIREQEKASG